MRRTREFGFHQLGLGVNSPLAQPEAIVLAELLTAVKSAFDQHRPEDMVRLFSGDAVFQGLSSTGVIGRNEIFDYFDALPPSITTTFQIIHARRLATFLIGGFADVRVTHSDTKTVPALLSLVLCSEDQKWSITQYHASKISRGNPFHPRQEL